MSELLREQASGEKDIDQITAKNSNRQNCDGFEGMNYEQFRQPYNPKHKNRNSTTDERNDSKRPDES